jgi:hypothetical protein
LGGAELSDENGQVPPYFDRRYGCKMEVIEFDSYHVNSVFETSVQALCEHFSGMSVVQPIEAFPLYFNQPSRMSQPA